MTDKPSLASIYLVIFLDMLGFGIIIPVLRDLTIEMLQLSGMGHYSPEVFGGLLMSAYSLAQFYTSPLIGRLSDRYGRRPLLLISVFGNVLSYALWAVSQSFTVFLLSRLVSGVTGGNISVAQSYIADVTTPEHRAKAMGMMGAIFGLGFILGPFIGAVLSQYDIRQIIQANIWNSFSAIGLFSMALSLLNMGWIYFALKEPDVKRLDTSFKKAVNPVVLLREFRKPELGKLFLIFFLSQVAFVHLEATLAWDLMARFSYDTRKTGYFFALMGIVMIFVQGGLYRVLLKHRPVRSLAIEGLMVTALAFFLLPLPATVGLYFLVITAMAYGMGIGNPSVSALVSLTSTPQDQGLNLGLMHSFGALARIIAPLTATALYAQWQAAPFLVAGLLVGIAVYIARQLPRVTEYKK